MTTIDDNAIGYLKDIIKQLERSNKELIIRLHEKQELLEHYRSLITLDLSEEK